MKNNILNILNKKGISINKLSKDLELSYSYTHGLVNREDLSTIQLSTLLNISNYLKVDITELYKEEGKMETNFNQEITKVIVRESGGNTEYDYNYFKEGFEEWAEKLVIYSPDLENLREFAISTGYKVIEVTEKDNLDELVDELKELIGAEFTLSEMDYTIQKLIDVDPGGANSIMNGDTKEYIERGEYSYTVWENEKGGNTRDINIHFKIHDMDLVEDIGDYTTIITDVELL